MSWKICQKTHYQDPNKFWINKIPKIKLMWKPKSCLQDVFHLICKKHLSYILGSQLFFQISYFGANCSVFLKCQCLREWWITLSPILCHHSCTKYFMVPFHSILWREAVTWFILLTWAKYWPSFLLSLVSLKWFVSGFFFIYIYLLLKHRQMQKQDFEQRTSWYPRPNFHHLC
jgi:hypothetical protein